MSAGLFLSSSTALGAAASGAAAPGAANPGPAGVSLRPADSSGAFDGRTNFRYKVDPGQSVTDYASIVNTGTQPSEFTLLATDAFNDSKGDFALLATDQTPKLVGRWVAFENGADRMKVTLAPGEGRLVPFTLTLPPTATPGDHVGAIVASVLSAQGQVQVDRRVAIRLYARVSGDLQPNLTVSSLSASYDGDWWNLLSGKVTVRYTVSNPGNVALAANVDGGVNTWFGIHLSPTSTAGIKEILPGNSASYRFQLPGVARWLFLNPYIRVNPFVDGSDVASYVLVAPSSRDTVLFAIPWIVLIGLLVLAGVIALIVWRRRVENSRAILWMENTEKRAREQALGENAGEPQETSSRP